MALAAQGFAWERIEHALGIWASQSSGGRDVRWTHYDHPRPPFPFVSLHRLTSRSVGRASRQYRTAVPTQTTITATSSTPGDTVAARVCWAVGRYVVQGGDTIGDVRDGLLADLTGQDKPGRYMPVTYAASGAADIVVSARGTQAASCEPLLNTTINVDTSIDAKIEEYPERSTILVRLFGFDGSGDDSIDEAASSMITALHNRDTIRWDEWGLGVRGLPEEITDESALSGPEFERRSSFRVSVGAHVRRFTPNPTYFTTAESIVTLAA